MCGASRVSREVVDDEYDDCPCDDLPQHWITSPELSREACYRELSNSFFHAGVFSIAQLFLPTNHS
jgi:hypothetical protein